MIVVEATCNAYRQSEPAYIIINICVGIITVPLHSPKFDGAIFRKRLKYYESIYQLSRVHQLADLCHVGYRPVS